MKSFSLTLLALILLTSCEETIDLKLNEGDKKLVIDAQVMNITRNTYVKISTTTAFSSVGKTPRVTNATVRIRDERGQVVAFVHNPRNHPDSAGFYLPQRRLITRVNATYTVEVVHEGTTYTASDAMPAVTTIGRLTTAVDAEEERRPRVEGRIYTALISFVLPEDDAYYQIKYLRNNAAVRENPGDVYLVDRKGNGTEVEDLNFPVFYSSGDRATVQLYRISKPVYDYYTDLSTINQTDGGLFNSPPVNPRTNWSNGAIGVFRVCALNERSIVVP